MKHLKISDVKQLAQANDFDQVIVLGWTRGVGENIATYGKTRIDCVQAADGGNRIKAFLTWPEDRTAMPAWVAKLQRENADLKAALVRANIRIDDLKVQE